MARILTTISTGIAFVLSRVFVIGCVYEWVFVPALRMVATILLGPLEAEPLAVSFALLQPVDVFCNWPEAFAEGIERLRFAAEYLLNTPAFVGCFVIGYAKATAWRPARYDLRVPIVLIGVTLGLFLSAGVSELLPTCQGSWIISSVTGLAAGTVSVLDKRRGRQRDAAVVRAHDSGIVRCSIRPPHD